MYCAATVSDGHMWKALIAKYSGIYVIVWWLAQTKSPTTVSERVAVNSSAGVARPLVATTKWHHAIGVTHGPLTSKTHLVDILQFSFKNKCSFHFMNF